MMTLLFLRAGYSMSCWLAAVGVLVLEGKHTQTLVAEQVRSLAMPKL